MTVSIDMSSIQITVHADDVRPLAVILNFPGKIVPAAPGSAAFFTSNKDEKALAAFGFKADARVRFSMAPGDALDGWKVGFFQIVRQTALRTRYTGRVQSEGSIVCDATPAISSQTLLDCLNKSTIPWMRDPDGKSKFTGSLASPSAHDEPRLSVPLLMQNHTASNINNFLYDFKHDCEFWTILTAIAPDQSRNYLAHFHWRVAHKVDFFWRSGVPSASEWGSFTILDKFVAGPPRDADLQAILANPSGPIANDIFLPAFDKSIKGNDFLTHSESDRGLSPMRLDFWASDLPPNVG
ncbi:hypothetical protein [Methylocella tundrae]|uniref:Uncharacterized protein n=1 Tax=Methylocella tundrae TaxID=227605 RepID=A0A4U8YY01_METTU|nr:hypothetical protein [Methylocella tundrae]WPP05764.1 hypothetical protein SIN04_08125 [Methylocella tundrae]VFU08262.1 protein of unknown function [Methylocella tundrae]